MLVDFATRVQVGSHASAPEEPGRSLRPELRRPLLWEGIETHLHPGILQKIALRGHQCKRKPVLPYEELTSRDNATIFW